MHRTVHTLTAAVILALQATGGGCQDVGGVGYDCHVVERGLRLEGGHVTDVVRNWCETGRGPQSQTFITWIQTRRNSDDQWLVSRRSSPSDTIPDREGVFHKLNGGRCQADIEYSMAWRAYGVDRSGVSFDTGTVQRLPGRADLC